MAYTTPTTRSTGDLITAAEWNTDLVDNIQFLANPPHCAVRHSSNQSHTTNGAWQAVVFNTEDEDTANLHSTSSNTSRITIPAGLGGLYAVSACIEFAGSAAGLRALGLRKNGTGGSGPNIKGRGQQGNPGTNSSWCWLATTVKLAAGDWIEAVAFQNSGGALNIQANTGEQYPYFTATWVGRG